MQRAKLNTLKVPLPHDLLIYQLLQLLLGQVILVLIEVEEFFWNGSGSWFVFWVMVWFQVWMLESFLYRDALHRVESQKLFQEVESEVGGLGEHILEWDLLLKW